MRTVEERRKYQREYVARKKREDPAFAARLKEAAARYHRGAAGKAKAKRWRAANAEKYKAVQDACRWRKPVAYLLAGAKARAKRRGLEFSLTVDDVVIPSHCPVLGIEITPARGYPKPGSPTIDRVNNDLGYVRDNIRVISHRANSLKSNATLGEVLSIYEYMLNETEAKLEART